MELNKLNYFYIVAKHEHITKAAEEIHIAQPSLTKSIKGLEEELGVALFYRKGRNIRLTDCGRFLKAKLDTILPMIEALPDEIGNVKLRENKKIKINVLAASTIATAAVIDYKKLRPDIIFEVIQNEEEEECDIVVTTGTADGERYHHSDFAEKSILNEQIYLAVPKASRYFGCESIELKDVKDEGFVSLVGSRRFRTVCDRFCMYAGFKPKTEFESDSIPAVKNIIAASAGVGFWPEYSWGEITSSDVLLLPITYPECRRDIIIGRYERGDISTEVVAFYNYLVDHMSKKKRSDKSPGKAL